MNRFNSDLFTIGQTIQIKSGLYKNFMGKVIEKRNDCLLCELNILGITFNDKIMWNDIIGNDLSRSNIEFTKYTHITNINHRSKIQSNTKTLNIGSKVVVIEGPLKGIEGEVLSVNSFKKRCKIKLIIAESAMTLDMAYDVIECIDEHLDELNRLNNNIEIAINSSILERIKNIDDIYKISPFQFENLVGELLEKQGLEIKMTPKSKDGGRDILSILKTPIGEILTIVECKQYSKDRKVGIEIAERFMWVCDHNDHASKAMIVTTSGFTKGCYQLREKYLYKLELKDLDSIIEWLKMYGSINKILGSYVWSPKYIR